jgi:seryl-tRNA synthetase
LQIVIDEHGSKINGKSQRSNSTLMTTGCVLTFTFAEIFCKMLQLQVLRQDPQAVKKKLAVKNFNQIDLVDEIIALDDQRKKFQLDFDNTQSKVNTASKEIGLLMAKGKKEEAATRKAEVASLKSLLQPITDRLAETEKQLQDELVKLPNLPSDRVPVGKTAEDNVVVREGGVKPQLPEGSAPHWDLISKYDIVDFETGSKITVGFPVYKQSAKLQQALINIFGLQCGGRIPEYLPPFMVNEASAFGTGRLPEKKGRCILCQPIISI